MQPTLVPRLGAKQGGWKDQGRVLPGRFGGLAQPPSPLSEAGGAWAEQRRARPKLRVAPGREDAEQGTEPGGTSDGEQGGGHPQPQEPPRNRRRRGPAKVRLEVGGAFCFCSLFLSAFSTVKKKWFASSRGKV